MARQQNTRLEQLERKIEPDDRGILMLAYDDNTKLYYDDLMDYDRAQRGEPITGKAYTEPEAQALAAGYDTLVVFRCPLARVA